MLKNKFSKQTLLLTLVFIVSVFFLSLLFSSFVKSENPFIEEINRETNIKSVVYKDIKIISPHIIMCDWSNSSSNWKDCEIVIEIENHNATHDFIEKNLPISKFKYNVNNMKVYTSTIFTTFNQSILNKTCFESLSKEEQRSALSDDKSLCYYNITKRSFSDWKIKDKIDKIPKGSPGILGIKLVFQSPIESDGEKYLQNYFDFTLFGDYNVILDPEISECSVLSQDGATYILTEDIIDADVGAGGSCMNISGNNITLDCQGHIIDGIFYGNSEVTYGVNIVRESITNTNITLKNCNISEWYYGCKFVKANNNTIQNTTSNSNRMGCHFRSSSSNHIMNSTMNFNVQNSIFLLDYCYYNVIENTIMNFNDAGIYIFSGSLNTIRNNEITNNTEYGLKIMGGTNNAFYNNMLNNTINVEFVFNIYNNYWNITKTEQTNIVGKTYIGGNYWANPSGTGYSQTCWDTSGDWICENPYVLNTTANNTDYLPLTLNQDLVPPVITIDSPINSTYNHATIWINVSADEEISDWLYSFNAGIVNTSFIPNISYVFPEGSHTVTIFANDTANNWGTNNVTFFVDFTFPVLYINFPQNTSYAVSNLTFNYTIIETNIDSCWYNNKSNANYTLTDCANITFTGIEGNNQIELYANDTAGNENKSGIRYYTIDTTIPGIVIQSPDNSTYTSSSVSFNVSINEETSACWYNNGSSSNFTLTKLNTTYFYKYETGLSEGNHFVEYYCNDTLNNENKTGKRYFGVDTIPLAIMTLSPDNTTYTTSVLDFNVTVNENASLCQYSLSGCLNISLIKENMTSWGKTVAGISEGSNYVIYSCNDTNNNWNSTTKRYFTVDTIYPVLYIDHPQNTSYTSNNITLNYTIIETNKGSCWYNNGSASNFTLTNCDTNITFLSRQGSINLTLYANDTTNKVNSTSVAFYVDSIIPFITIQSPDNTTYTTSVLDFNVTVNENASLCQYSLSGCLNISLIKENMTSWGKTVAGISEGSNYVIYSCNDTNNNWNSTTKRYFTVDTVPPFITILSPTNSSYNINSIDFNVTTSEDSSLCQYSLDHASNVSLIKENATAWGKTVTEISEGSRNVIFSCNDTFNNWNSTNISFFVDTIPPILYIDFPQNTSYTTTNTTLNYTITDVTSSVSSCWYNLNNETNITIESCVNITFTSSQGSTNLTLFANDTQDNTNQTSVVFYVDSISPSITINRPEEKTYAYETDLSLNCTVSDSGIGLSSCWYKVINSTSYIIIDNTTLTSCTNTTFNVPRDGNYNVTVYSNDSLNNENNAVRKFAISTDKPAIELNAPSNNKWFNNGTTINFNFTSTDSDGISTCNLWSNFTGTWHLNYTWIHPTSGIQNYTTLDLNDGIYKWNVWCNDTLNKENWAMDNFTVSVDTVYPQIIINEPTHSTYRVTYGQTVYTLTINTTITDNTQIDTSKCYYNVTEIGGHGTTISDTSYNCNSTTAFIAVPDYPGLYNYILTIKASDMSDNQQIEDVTFAIAQRAPEEDGGGGRPIQEVTVEEFEDLSRLLCPELWKPLKDAFGEFIADTNWQTFKNFWRAFWNYVLCNTQVIYSPLYATDKRGFGQIFPSGSKEVEQSFNLTEVCWFCK